MSHGIKLTERILIVIIMTASYKATRTYPRGQELSEQNYKNFIKRARIHKEIDYILPFQI